MSAENLKQIHGIIAGKKANLTHEEARELANRALRFKEERGRLPSATAADPWERRMAEGIAVSGPLAVRGQKTLVREWEQLPIDEAVEAGIDAFERAYQTDEPARMMQPFLSRKQ